MIFHHVQGEYVSSEPSLWDLKQLRRVLFCSMSLWALPFAPSWLFWMKPTPSIFTSKTSSCPLPQAFFHPHKGILLSINLSDKAWSTRTLPKDKAPSLVFLLGRAQRVPCLWSWRVQIPQGCQYISGRVLAWKSEVLAEKAQVKLNLTLTSFSMWKLSFPFHDWIPSNPVIVCPHWKIMDND